MWQYSTYTVVTSYCGRIRLNGVRSFVLKASTVKCRLIPLIDPQSTRLTFNRPLGHILTNTRSSVDQDID